MDDGALEAPRRGGGPLPPRAQHSRDRPVGPNRARCTVGAATAVEPNVRARPLRSASSCPFGGGLALLLGRQSGRVASGARVSSVCKPPRLAYIGRSAPWCPRCHKRRGPRTRPPQSRSAPQACTRRIAGASVRALLRALAGGRQAANTEAVATPSISSAPAAGVTGPRGSTALRDRIAPDEDNASGAPGAPRPAGSAALQHLA